jgi:hypothetical protein
MTSVLMGLIGLAGTVLRGVLPYPDLLRRRRVRANARKLVVCRRWPADEAVTGEDLVQLALLRVLRLQSETRKATRTRQREAAVLLARSSLEACILGLYCLHSPTAFPKLRQAHLKAGIESLKFLGDDDLFPEELLRHVVEMFGTPASPMTVKAMVDAIDKATGGGDAASLYNRLYRPTSTFFVHANATSLSRHVAADDSLTARPSMPWARRSPVRLADACVGLLAAAIAAHRGAPSPEFATYARDHIMRVLAPIAVRASKRAGRSGVARQVLMLVPEVIRLRRYLQSPQAAANPAQKREARVRPLFDRLGSVVFSPDIPTAAVQSIVDHFVELVLRESEQQ